ncbi:putative ribonuclease H protein [Vitis vinifera]|uniref:Putative ribonuclease H protein n=1 Tax=Vitis vinifera TaxID=29760 RepID=A0A438DC91_VITVI|nr:putative ribonuclease H protein [Vitis vinifera]
MVKPSSPETRGKGPSLMGNCVPRVAENLEFRNGNGGDPACCPYQMSESVNSLSANLRSPCKESSKATVHLGGIFQEEEQMLHRIVRLSGFGSEIRVTKFHMKIISWNTRGLGSKKKRRVVKDFLRSEKPDVVMFQETKKEECDRRFVGSVWTARNKDWAALPACGASGGILIIWDAKKLSREEVVLGSFSVSIKFALNGCESLWLSAVYGPNNSALRKDFWVELSDIAGLASPRWCVGGDFNVIRRSSEKLGGSRLTPSMKDFDDFISDCELIDLPLRSASFTWSNMQVNPVCKRLDRFLYSNEWEQHFLKVFKEYYQDGHRIIGRLSWKLIRSSGVQRRSGLKICGCNILVLRRILEDGGGSFKEMGGKGTKSIKEEILRYFEKLYTSPSGESWRVEGLDWSPISGESAFRLESPLLKKRFLRLYFRWTGIRLRGRMALPLQCFKIVGNRAYKRVLHETIHSTQGAFVQGRQILDAVLIANEIVDEKRRSGEEGVVFKIDFEKAYDHVSWDFLDHVLEMKGFGIRWRKWMRGCLSSVSFAVLVNGNAKGWVKASRGLRQGDPLSPFLFTIVADVLSRMLLKFKAEERKVLEGFKVGRNRTRVSHLQFADDTIFFSSSREEDMMTLKNVLLVFGHISGLKVNLDKSNIYGINLEQNHLSRLAEMLDCKASGWPILYLGLPLGGNPKTSGFWDPVIERISRRLDGWQKAYLSFGGRITLIQSCLTHMPCYFLSLFKIPASVAAKIERMQRDFLWSGVGEGKRDHLVNWDVVILSIYGSHSNGWDVNNIVRWSHRCPWKAIALVYQEFSKFTRFVVGNGDRIRFWDDLWWGEQPLGVQYPRLLRVVTDKNAPISSILGYTRPFSWNFTFRRNLSDSEIEDLEGLMQSFDRLHISSSVPDKRSWSLSPSGLFTVKSFFLALSQYSESPPIFPTKFVWNAQVPFKVKSFVWLVAHKKVNTNDLLQLRRPYKALSPDICKLCMKHGETVDHLFLHCSLTIGLWHRLFQSAKMDWVSPRSISDMLASNFNGFGFSKRGIVLWQNACIALMWVVWRERNARIFEDKARNSEYLWDSICFLTSFWAFCSKVFKGIPLNMLQLDWLAACN